MLQVKIAEVGKVIYEDVPEPKAGPGEALLDVKSVGICGSDIHVFEGKNPVSRPPVIQGHEFGGIIKSINDSTGTSSFRIGQKVAVFPILNCRKCYYCQKGIEHMCSDQKLFAGKKLDGAMKEEISIPLDNLVPLPSSFDLTYAPIIEPAAVSLHAVDHISMSNILIIGMGTLGLTALQVCKSNGNKVIASDIDSVPLERATFFGADLVLDLKERKDIQRLEDFREKEKINYVLDCVNNESTVKLAIDNIDKKGEIILLGVPISRFGVDLLKILMHEIVLKGSYLYSKNEYIKAKDYVLQGIIDVKGMKPKIFALSSAVEAYTYKIKNRSKKVLLTN